MANQQYIDFDKYIRQGEPGQKEKAYAWGIAIGLQAVDGLKTSEYLHEIARQNIEGKITGEEALGYDLEQERQFNYGGLTSDEIVEHISKFTANLWQIHAFGEGNTRATAVFVILYLRSLGFNVNNDIFRDNSWYFRNALVRYVYKNREGVMPEPKYLERFFRNMLLGEQWALQSRYLYVNPPEEYKVQPRLDTPTSSVHSGNTFDTENAKIKRLVFAIGDQLMSVKDMLTAISLKDRQNFLNYYLTPAIEEGFVRMLYPDSPHHPRQKYLLTVKGLGFYNQNKNK